LRELDRKTPGAETDEGKRSLYVEKKRALSGWNPDGGNLIDRRKGSGEGGGVKIPQPAKEMMAFEGRSTRSNGPETDHRVSEERSSSRDYSRRHEGASTPAKGIVPMVKKAPAATLREGSGGRSGKQRESQVNERDHKGDDLRLRGGSSSGGAQAWEEKNHVVRKIADPRSSDTLGAGTIGGRLPSEKEGRKIKILQLGKARILMFNVTYRREEGGLSEEKRPCHPCPGQRRRPPLPGKKICGPRSRSTRSTTKEALRSLSAKSSRSGACSPEGRGCYEGKPDREGKR